MDQRCLPGARPSKGSLRANFFPLGGIRIVIEADDAPSAIAVLQDPGCIVDLVFSDVRMPGAIDGIGLSRWIFENRPNVPVILASGEVGKATAIQDLCGAETMTKPFDFSTLTSTIHAAITKKQTPPAC